MAAASYTAGLLHGLSRSWQSRGPLAWLLWPISLLYQALLHARNALYHCGWLPSRSCAVPLLVVGNVLAGGVGKTPVVMALLGHLQQRGLRIGVISRGHGRRSSGCVEVNQGSLPADVGDEPLLIKRRTGAPVVVAKRRAEAADLLLARHPDTELIISDDGLQHRALLFDYAVCVFDNRGIGNGMLLPAGPLREPWPRPVDLVLHTGDSPAFGGFSAHRRLGAKALRQDGSALALSELAGSNRPRCWPWRRSPDRRNSSACYEPAAWFWAPHWRCLTTMILPSGTPSNTRGTPSFAQRKTPINCGPTARTRWQCRCYSP